LDLALTQTSFGTLTQLGFWINLQAATKVLLSEAFFVVFSLDFEMISTEKKHIKIGSGFFLSSYLALKPFLSRQLE
jgi:hypothetical protein